MQIEGAIFDVDGTLGNTVYVSVEAIARTVERYTGSRLSHPEVIARFGPAEQGIIRDLVPPEVWLESCQVFLEEYESIHQKEQIGAFPGLTDVLEFLVEKDIRLAVVTGKGVESAAISMRYFGLDSYFDYIEAGSLDRSIKEDCIKKVVAKWGIPPANTIYFGDAPSDVPIARRAGVIPVSVAWADTADPAELFAENPTALFETTKDLLIWLQNQLDGTAPEGENHVP